MVAEHPTVEQLTNILQMLYELEVEERQQQQVTAAETVRPGGYMELLLSAWDGVDPHSTMLQPGYVPVHVPAAPVGDLGPGGGPAFDPMQLVRGMLAG